jgi:hypothetical protein
MKYTKRNFKKESKGRIQYTVPLFLQKTKMATRGKKKGKGD